MTYQTVGNFDRFAIDHLNTLPSNTSPVTKNKFKVNLNEKINGVSTY
jgi:hypothetical protein